MNRYIWRPMTQENLDAFGPEVTVEKLCDYNDGWVSVAVCDGPHNGQVATIWESELVAVVFP